jgi:hypothetical protein
VVLSATFFGDEKYAKSLNFIFSYSQNGKLRRRMSGTEGLTRIGTDETDLRTGNSKDEITADFC